MTDELETDEVKDQRHRTREQSRRLQDAIKIVYSHRAESTILVDISLEDLGELFSVSRQYCFQFLKDAGILIVEDRSNDVGVDDLLEQLRKLNRDTAKEFQPSRKHLSMKAIAETVGLSEIRLYQLRKPGTKTAPEVRAKLQTLINDLIKEEFEDLFKPEYR